jgi:hypothetical protein
MEAVRLINGQEHSPVEHKDIAALLDLLCEHPLTDGRAESSPELAAFCREAAKALSQAGAARPEGGDIAESGPLMAALAALLSGADMQAARRSVADAMLRSASARLDAQSALAFIAAIERSPQSAPAHLVEEMLAGEIAGAARPAAPRERVGIANIWSLIAGSSWSARRWRMAAVCTVLLMAGVASVYRVQMNPAIEGAPPSPMVRTLSQPAAVAPAPPPPALARVQPCKPRSATGEAIIAQNIPPADGSPISATTEDCVPKPGRGFADHAANGIEAITARHRAETARRAAAAREAAKVGAARADHSSNSGPVEVDRPRSVFDTKHRNIPTSAVAASPAAPAKPPVSPAGQP